MKQASPEEFYIAAEKSRRILNKPVVKKIVDMMRSFDKVERDKYLEKRPVKVNEFEGKLVVSENPYFAHMIYSLYLFGLQKIPYLSLGNLEKEVNEDDLFPVVQMAQVSKRDYTRIMGTPHTRDRLFDSVFFS